MENTQVHLKFKQKDLFFQQRVNKIQRVERQMDFVSILVLCKIVKPFLYFEETLNLTQIEFDALDRGMQYQSPRRNFYKHCINNGM